MNQPRQIFKNTVVLTIGHVAGMASSILLAYYVSRLLHATGLGIYSTVIAYYGLIALAGAMGTRSFVVRELSKEPSRTNRYLIHLGAMGLVVSAVIVTLFLIVVPHLGYSAELTTGMYVISLAIFPGTLAIIQEAAFIAHQKAEFVTYTTLIKVIGKVGVSLHLLTRGYGAVSLAVVFVVFEYVGMVCYLYFTLRYITTLRWEFEFSLVLQLAREIKTFAALSLLTGLFAQPEVIILSLVRNEAQVGIYSAALKLVTLWYLILEPFMGNVLPVLSRSYHSSDQKYQIIQEKSIKYLMAVALPLAMGMMTAAGPIINLLYGPGFERSATVLRWLAWIIPMFFFSNVLWRILTARGEQHLDLRVRIITTVARLGLGFLLISSLGDLGAAMVALIILALNDLLLAIYVQRDGTRLHLLRLSWRFALAALGMGIFILAFGQQLHLLALVPIAGVIYGALVILLKGFSPDDLALFRKIWQPGMSDSRKPISTN